CSQEHQRDSKATGPQNHCFGIKHTLEEKRVTLSSTNSTEVENSSSTPKCSQQASCSGTASTAK
ncbi:hypothetical protein A2U01_0100958, partial [Trifolium medium]|nr:hypothetical protein [Trifolium medium]